MKYLWKMKKIMMTGKVISMSPAMIRVESKAWSTCNGNPAPLGCAVTAGNQIHRVQRRPTAELAHEFLGLRSSGIQFDLLSSNDRSLPFTEHERSS